MRLSPNHVDYLAFLIYKAMKDSPHITINNPDAIVSTAHARIIENLKLEDELEKEALATLAKHRQQILGNDADYQKMVREAVKILARKRGAVI
jgi:hypothetical protein